MSLGGPELNAFLLELAAQHLEVVDLAVVDQTEAPFFIPKGLGAAITQIDEGQPGVGKAHARLRVKTAPIRPAMPESTNRLAQPLGLGGALAISMNNSENPAHGSIARSPSSWGALYTTAPDWNQFPSRPDSAGARIETLLRSLRLPRPQTADRTEKGGRDARLSYEPPHRLSCASRRDWALDHRRIRPVIGCPPRRRQEAASRRTVKGISAAR